MYGSSLFSTVSATRLTLWPNGDFLLDCYFFTWYIICLRNWRQEKTSPDPELNGDYIELWLYYYYIFIEICFLQWLTMKSCSPWIHCWKFIWGSCIPSCRSSPWFGVTEHVMPCRETNDGWKGMVYRVQGKTDSCHYHYDSYCAWYHLYMDS